MASELKNSKRMWTWGLIYSSLAVCCIFLAYFIMAIGPEKGVAVAVAIIGITIGAFALINFRFGFYTSFAVGFVVFFIGRLVGEWFPIGVVVDLFVLVTFTGLLIDKAKNRESIFLYSNHIVSYIYLIYTAFLFIQVFNPNMGSVAGWFLIFRKFLQFMMVYIIALNLFNNLKEVGFFFKFIIICATLTGLYGCYQEWVGFLPFELNWIFSDSKRVGLYMLYDGSFRKFGTLSDPAAYGITMAAFALLSLILAINTVDKTRKMLLILGGVILLLAVAFSGTRTSYFIITVGILLYVLMTITNKRTLLFAGVFSCVFVVIVWGPIYGNTTINRIRSTFDFSNDGSLEVRDVNRAKIQPYIYSHPIGGGLATSGAQGQQYNPGHYLAGFPPDSGFIKTAIETGWIGFTLQCLIYFFILQSAVSAYFRTEHKTIKTYLLAILVCQFSFVIAQYGQEAIAQIPGFFLFYSSIALVVRLKQISEGETSNSKDLLEIS